MRAHLDGKRVLFITMVAVAVGWAGVAEAAPFVSRPLTLPRSDWSLDLGLGLHHIRTPNPDNDYTGFGLNLEAMVGITSFVQLGLRTGIRLDRDGRRRRGDNLARPF